MPSPLYTAIKPNEEHTNTVENNASPSLSVDPFIAKPAWTYLLYLIPLVAIVIFPLTFAGYILAKGHVVAFPSLSTFAKSNPRVTSQIIAILSTSLTATARWGLGGAAALLARKRFLQPRPVYEIDVFFSLRNISVIWDWKHRRRMMVFTWFLVILCGLLTSGFFTLLNPLPMKVDVQHSPAREINLAADSNSWAEWYDRVAYNFIRRGAAGAVPENAHRSDVPRFLESVTRQYITSKNQSRVYSPGSLVASSKEFGYTSFVGSTAGVLIGGTEGLAYQITPLGRPADEPSYSLVLQGLWIDVSCSLGAPPLDATTFSTPGETDKRYNATCPGSSIVKEGKISPVVGMVLAIDCPADNNSTLIRFLTSDSWYGFGKDNSVSFKMADGMACNVSPRIGDVDALLDPDLKAFKLSKRNSATIPFLPPVARNVTGLILEHVMRHLENSPLSVNMFEALETASEDELATMKSMIPELMALMLSTVFEFEASWVRYTLSWKVANFTSPEMPSVEIPPEFVREVEVVLHKDTVGWIVKKPTLLGLVPLVAISIVAFVMLAMAFWTRGQLTLFDPTSPVSLLAATSVGEVVFPNHRSGKTIGGCLDEDDLTKKVHYARKGMTWGLWSLGGSLEGNMKRSA